MKKFFYILIPAIILSSCSEYQKVLKESGEGAVKKKFEMGEALYNDGKFAKASRLFAQIVPEYRGKPQAQKLMYLYAMTFYEMKDYYTSAYRFEQFTTAYPKSEKLEEAAFLSAKSYYMLSPAYTKDQKETTEAIEKTQEFINRFPDSKYLEDANKLVKELEFKLEQKAFHIAKQYSDIAPGFTRDFTAAIKSFDNFLYEFPGSKLREDAFYYRLDAVYQQAVNSFEYISSREEGVVQLRKQRLETAKEYGNSFKKMFANSKYTEQVNEMVSAVEEELNTYSTQS
ncbi:outer membrane protein assembly factor BamD [Seonamhaeicola algicola]|uniref:Outer membrane protein assembly factor BamD n=1 Tax=Seonamhaeicola algicola TaxID=1719036 RepID=A0A5C7AT92_9FLAO|nr:outer membrane protein assembly factor BamD [Seonamhaeicola algicola]TXE11956.1 outer membrane protein assembly factor BamD [Seonamhaeicola algicola]